MAKEKNITFNSWPKKPKFLENMRTPSNLQRSSCQLVNQFDLSNTVDDPIEPEEMGDPSKSSEQE